MITTKDIKKILKENNIKYKSYGDKGYLLGLLTENGIQIFNKEDTVKTLNRYERLKKIRLNPKKVTLENVNTGEIIHFSSIYKAAKFINRCPQMISNWDGKVWENKYVIKIL